MVKTESESNHPKPPHNVMQARANEIPRALGTCHNAVVTTGHQGITFQFK
jgi:hypothetical protein